MTIVVGMCQGEILPGAMLEKVRVGHLEAR